MAVSAIVLVGALTASRAQQKAYYDGQQVREAQGTARNALLYLEEKLPLAGFGMDPALALDFGWYTGPCPTELSPCSRDSKTNADELVFYARHPSYWVPQLSSDDFRGHVWQLVSLDAASNSLTVKARTGDSFPRGQILQLVCEGGSRWAYVTVATTVTRLNADDAELELTLEDEGAGTNPFRGQSLATDACFSASGGVRPRAFQIDRYRFHLRPVDDGSGVPDPFLVLDTGVDVNGDNQVTIDDELILAEGIETMQVAYHFTNSDLGEAGATAGTAITFADGTAATADDVVNKIVRTTFPGPAPASAGTGEFVYARTSFFPYTFGPPVAAERDTNHQANVRGVRVRLLARSARRDEQRMTESPLRSGVAVMNLDSSPTWLGAARGYEWIPLETTVALPNMTSRRLLDQ